jgi:hypothetical protein
MYDVAPGFILGATWLHKQKRWIFGHVLCSRFWGVCWLLALWPPLQHRSRFRIRFLRKRPHSCQPLWRRIQQCPCPSQWVIATPPDVPACKDAEPLERPIKFAWENTYTGLLLLVS